MLEIGDYREASNLVRASKLTSVNSPDLLSRVKFLNPVTFRNIVASEAQLSTDTASAILPIILSTIQLRRVKGEAILVQGTKVIIGPDIPMYKVVTIVPQKGVLRGGNTY